MSEETTGIRLPSADTTAVDMPTSEQLADSTTDTTDTTAATAATPRIDSGTVARFLVLLLALANQALTMFGRPVLNIDDTAVTQLVSLLWTTISALWCYWKDNDITVRARARKARLAGKHAA